MMKQLSRDEIVEYTRRTVRANEHVRWISGVVGAGVLVLLGCLAWLLHLRVQQDGSGLLTDTRFLAGLAFGILFMLAGLCSALAFIRMLPLRRGIEHQSLKRLLELEKRLNNES